MSAHSPFETLCKNFQARQLHVGRPRVCWSSEIAKPSCDNRAPTRRSLKPVLGCLRRNRRRLFAAAVTRYLKSVYAAVVADTGDFPRRQANKRPATEGDEGGGRKVAGSGAISARDLACNQRTPGHRWQADPARRAACGPSTGSGAAGAPFRHVGTATESNEVSVARGAGQGARIRVRALG